MKAKAYAEVRKELAQQRDGDPAEELLPCRYCSTQTPHSELSRYGARCRHCFEQFLRVGHSGSTPPRQPKQAPWVQRELAQNRLHAARHDTGDSAFAALAQQMHSRIAEHDALRGLSEDEVNGLLAGGGL